ncbi:MAG: hypothetical protein H6707_13660 [Deltaproteobacteria bacterium]|nr:hypothetical protein [Deltaproteobacteria bacterium]
MSDKGTFSLLVSAPASADRRQLATQLVRLFGRTIDPAALGSGVMLANGPIAELHRQADRAQIVGANWQILDQTGKTVASSGTDALEQAAPDELVLLDHALGADQPDQSDMPATPEPPRAIPTPLTPASDPPLELALDIAATATIAEIVDTAPHAEAHDVTSISPTAIPPPAPFSPAATGPQQAPSRATRATPADRRPRRQRPTRRPLPRLWGGLLRERYPRARVALAFLLGLGLGGIAPMLHVAQVNRSQLEPARLTLARTLAYPHAMRDRPGFRPASELRNDINQVRARHLVLTLLFWLACSGALTFAALRFS